MITMHIASSQSDIYIMPTSKPCVLKPLKSITTASLRLILSNSCTQIYKSFVLSIKKIRVKKKTSFNSVYLLYMYLNSRKIVVVECTCRLIQISQTESCANKSPRINYLLQNTIKP